MVVQVIREGKLARVIVVPFWIHFAMDFGLVCGDIRGGALPRTTPSLLLSSIRRRELSLTRK